jgi:plastocyanin
MPGMRRIAFVFAATVLAGTAACGDSGPTTTTTQAATNQTVASTGRNFGPAATVALKGLEFLPKVVTIKKGERVEWLWQDSTTHNITSATFKSETMAGPKFEYTFNTPGDFDYQCTLHAGMTGTVKVT